MVTGSRIISAVAALTFLLASVFPESADAFFGGGKKKKWVKSKHGVGALMELSGDRGKMEREYREETRSFKEVKKAVEHEALRKGAAAFEVKKDFGEPVVEIPGEKAGEVRWVYKAASSDFFTGEKVYLIFGPEGKLIEWGIDPGSPDKKQKE
ncbi:MAG: hypothetical protein GF408_02465 [Candidatus Omnitrophica bacterium]|nr:hypothetical protein [Candidatus Omnitrophota bacterium]